MKIKLGIFDYPIPAYKDKKEYIGTETRNDYTGWNVSTANNSPNIQNILLNEYTKFAKT